ncbi:MAG: AarF/ABC1/UbiB kinase family protein [Deltaproteobacteria bacterium]|jgi:predicted unusual protein kinase regulating ubiquinone biosynthesis (AarF/ABC1/UbiB family)
MARRLPKDLPTGLLSRARATGRIALQVGLRSAKVFGDRDRADEALGAVLLAELDQLKGMAMKVGQILSYMDVGFPEPVTTQLARLRTGVTPLPFDVIVEALEAGLGASVDAHFAELEPEPIASASIGQVHRGRTLDCDPVAVKVLYPNVRETLEADFAQLDRLSAIAGKFSAVDGKALVAELFARVAEECDYEREAEWQRRFGAFFANTEGIVVPRVFDALSCPTVLTTAWAEGDDFEDFCRVATSEARDRASDALLRFAFAPFFARGWLHADPHPGNQRYGERVTLLDFGCVRAFDPDFVVRFARFSRAVLDEDRAAFRTAAIELGLAPRPERIDFDALFAQYAWQYEPVRTPCFAFTDAWWARGQAFTKPTAKNARHVGFPPEWIWLSRVQWGLWAVLKRIGGRADLRATFAQMLEEHDAESLHRGR